MIATFTYFTLLSQSKGKDYAWFMLKGSQLLKLMNTHIAALVTQGESTLISKTSDIKRLKTITVSTAWKNISFCVTVSFVFTI